MSKRLLLIAAAGLFALLGLGYFLVGDEVVDRVVGPADYVHFSDYFTMNESTAYEMNMDGGTAQIAPGDPEAQALAGNQAEAVPADSPAVVLED